MGQKVKTKKSLAGTSGRRVARGTGGGGWLTGMEKLYKPIKRPVTLRLDADVIAWFQSGGRGYQTRINRALRQLMLKGRKPAS
jgi:hypothetical protein